MSRLGFFPSTGKRSFTLPAQKQSHCPREGDCPECATTPSTITVEFEINISPPRRRLVAQEDGTCTQDDCDPFVDIAFVLQPTKNPCIYETLWTGLSYDMGCEYIIRVVISGAAAPNEAQFTWAIVRYSDSVVIVESLPRNALTCMTAVTSVAVQSYNPGLADWGCGGNQSYVNALIADITPNA